MAESVILDPPDGIASTNLATNPKAGSGVTTGWTNNAIETFAAATPPTITGLPGGVQSAFHANNTTGSGNAAITAPVVNGSQYRFSAYVYLATLGTSTGVQLRVRNAADTANLVVGSLTTTTGAWTRLDVSFTATATESYIFQVIVGAGSVDFYFTGVFIEQSANLNAYFDGETAPALGTTRYAWTGAQNTSTSTRTILRVSFDLTQFISSDGIDWGTATIEQYLAQAQVGQLPIDYRIPNRPVSIPLKLQQRGTFTFEDARRQIQAKAALFHRKGGWLSRVTSAGTFFADIVGATLKLGGGWAQANRSYDVDALLELELIPDFYGAEIVLDDMSETANTELVGVLKQSASNAVIKGDYPGRVRVVVDDDQGAAQYGVMWGYRSWYYDSATTAALAYEAEALTPLDAATRTSLAGASGGTVVQHASLSASSWTPVLSTTMLAGTAQLTHRGTYRTWARCYSTSATPPRVQLVWDTGDINAPEENTAQRIPAASSFFDVDLGEIRIDEAPAGAHRWSGQFQAIGDAGGENISLDKVWFVPVDDGYGVLRMSPSSLAGAIGARDSFTGTTSGGTLNGRTAPLGGTWATSGAATDFTFTDTASMTPAGGDSEGITRSSTSTAFRFAVLGGAATDQQVSVLALRPHAVIGGTLFDLPPCGVIGRWVDSSNYLRLTAEQPSGSTIPLSQANTVKLVKVIAGVETVLSTVGSVGSILDPGAIWKMTLSITASGNITGTVTGPLNTGGSPQTLNVFASDSATATGGTLQSGKAGIIDSGNASAVPVRNYDNFAAMIPPPEPVVINASKSIELRTEGHFREASTSAGFDKVNAATGDLPRLPPSGIEAKPVELFVKASRGDFDQRADTNIDDLSAQVFYRPSWLNAPGT